MLRDGQVFDNKYVIERVIGQGGMGTVYLAKNINLGTLWAIKSIDKKNQNDFDLLAEPNILKKLNHHALPRIFDIIEDEQFIYIVEDYIEGIPLDRELKRVETFNEQQVIEWAKQICDALGYLHSIKPNPIIYRDMKPQNLIISRDNKIKIIDFGIAREYKKESTDDTTYIGTRGYAAPEQYGTAQTDARTDIYSLGVTLYHLLTGKSPNDPPYEIRPAREFNKNLSRGIEYIIDKCTRQDPQKRYQNVAALLYDLNNIKKYDLEYRRKKLKKDITIAALIILFASFVLLTKTGWHQLQQERIDSYMNLIEQGITSRENGQFEEALNFFEQASILIPENPRADQEEAMVYFSQNDYEQAIEHIDTVISEMSRSIYLPENSKVLADLNYIKGSSYYEQEQYKEAVESMRKAYTELVHDPLFVRNYVISLARTDNLSEAEQVLQQAKNSGLYDDTAAYLGGEILFMQEKYQEAETHYLDALELTEDEEIRRMSYISLSELYRNAETENDDYLDREIAILERAEKELVEKNNIIIMERLAEAYSLKANQLEGDDRTKFLTLSAQKFESLLATGYVRPYIMRNTAILYQNAGNLDESEKMLSRMIETYPEDYSAYMQMAFLCAEIESTKDNEYRDYTRTMENYEIADRYYQIEVETGADDVQMKALEAMIQELKDKKWIK